MDNNGSREEADVATEVINIYANHDNFAVFFNL